MAPLPAAVEQMFFRVCAVCGKQWRVILRQDGATHQVIWRATGKFDRDVVLRRRR